MPDREISFIIFFLDEMSNQNEFCIIQKFTVLLGFMETLYYSGG